jgi:predicted nucleic acid-binding protein
MQVVFADAFYWIALLDRGDDWHARVRAFASNLAGVQIVTTEEVLVEVLAALREGRIRRRIAERAVRDILQDPTILLVPQTHDSFLAGLDLHAARPDKEYSLTDCISMQTIRAEGIVHVLTNDRHFEQEGFTRLFRS